MFSVEKANRNESIETKSPWRFHINLIERQQWHDQCWFVNRVMLPVCWKKISSSHIPNEKRLGKVNWLVHLGKWSIHYASYFFNWRVARVTIPIVEATYSPIRKNLIRAIASQHLPAWVTSYQHRTKNSKVQTILQHKIHTRLDAMILYVLASGWVSVQLRRFC